MKIIEVTTPQHRKEFLQLPVRIFKDAPNWIRPLDKDVELVFDPTQNKSFRNGECTRWILQNEQGKTIGRVAAFVDRKRANKGNDQPTGGMGFFHCIDDQEAAFKLFDTCKAWLEERGMEAMDGPINFGERDKWWGLLVDGFDIEPNYCMPYNKPYYQNLFEAYGFKVYFKQFTYGRLVQDPISPKLKKKADMVFKDPKYTFRHLEKDKLEKYTEDFRTVYNKAWGGHSGVPTIDQRQARAIMKQLKPIMDEKILWFGYYEDQPVTFFLMIPELNQSFKYLNGGFNLLRKIQFMWVHKVQKLNRKVLGLVFGVVPEFQGKGVDGGMIESFRNFVQKKGGYKRYDYLEMNWIGDFNPKMMVVVEQVGASIVKTHHTYRKLFDETKPFKRMPIVGSDKKANDKDDQKEV